VPTQIRLHIPAMVNVDRLTLDQRREIAQEAARILNQHHELSRFNGAVFDVYRSTTTEVGR
jgi:hypothetical protein